MGKKNQVYAVKNDISGLYLTGCTTLLEKATQWSESLSSREIPRSIGVRTVGNKSYLAMWANDHKHLRMTKELKNACPAPARDPGEDEADWYPVVDENGYIMGGITSPKVSDWPAKRLLLLPIFGNLVEQ